MKKIVKRLLILVFIIVLIIGGYNIFNRIKNIDFNKYSDLLNLAGKGSLIENYANLEDSGITGEEYTFNELYYPYYANLSSDEKELYKQIYANINSLERTFVPVTYINYNEVTNIIESVTYDHPEFFYLAQTFTYKYTKDGICRQITLDYNDLINNIESNRNIFDKEVNVIVNGASKYNTNYEKELYVHDMLIKKISYNTNALYNQTAYSALVNKSTVCAGYSKAFQYIMQKLSIPTYYVTGISSGEDHAWNIIYLDGYYNVDLTWDDAASYNYYYFNLTDREFSSSHRRSSLSNSLPMCSSTTYSYNNQNKKKTIVREEQPPKQIIDNSTPKDEQKESISETPIEEEIEEELDENTINEPSPSNPQPSDEIEEEITEDDTE